MTHLASLVVHLYEDNRGRRWSLAIESTCSEEERGELTLRDGHLTASCGVEEIDGSGILSVHLCETAVRLFGPRLEQEIENKRQRREVLV